MPQAREGDDAEMSKSDKIKLTQVTSNVGCCIEPNQLNSQSIGFSTRILVEVKL